MTRADLIAALRRHLAETRDVHREPPLRTLDELAETDDALRTRVAQVRAALPAEPSGGPSEQEAGE